MPDYPWHEYSQEVTAPGLTQEQLQQYYAQLNQYYLNQLTQQIFQPSQVFTTLNDNTAGISQGGSFWGAGVAAAPASPEVAGAGGAFTGLTWVGPSGPEASVLAEDEAPSLDRPDDFDLHSWESLARDRARRSRRESKP